jgi:hypothetical protein
MIIRARYLGLLALGLSAAFADEKLKREFDAAQSARLIEIQKALEAENIGTARSLARTHSQRIDDQLKKHGDFGPHQRKATTQFGSTLLTKEIVDHLKSFSMYSGQKVSTVSNNFFMENYGIELKYVENADKSKPGTWTAEAPKDNTKVLDFMKSKLDGDAKKVWDSLSVEQKNDVAKIAISQVGSELKSVIPQDGEITSAMGDALAKKSTEMEKLIEDRKKDMASAEFLDTAEKRMLTSEKNVADALKDGADSKTIAQFCEEYAASMSNPEDIQRRVGSITASDPCAEPLKKRLASITASNSATSTVSREPAVDEPSTTPIFEETGEAEDEDEDDRNETTDDKKAKDRALADQAEADKKTKELEAQVQQMQQAMLGAQGERDTLQNALNMAQQCQRSVGSTTDPFGLNPDNQKNEKMIASLKDEMEKVLVDNYSAAVCEQATKTGNMRSAAENVLAGLVPEGALTEADQRKLKGVSQGALDQAGAFAKKRSSRMKLMAQLQEAASKRALTRLTMEYSTLINMSTVGYLKTLSHTDLVGIDGMGFGGALTKASSNPTDPTLTLQAYNSLYDSAMLDLTKKYGTGEDYEMNAECALTLAQVASSRWSEEAGRMTALFGPARQSAFRTLSSMTTDVKNAPSSEVEATKNYRKR